MWRGLVKLEGYFMTRNIVLNKIYFPIVLLSLINIGCVSNSNRVTISADPTEEAKKVLYRYYENIKNGNYAAASENIFEDDLELFKILFFPHYIKTRDSIDENLLHAENLTLYYGNIEDITAESFFAHFYELFMAINKNIQNFFKGINIAVINSILTDNTIIFEIGVTHPLRAAFSRDFHTLIYQNGKWNIRLNFPRLNLLDALIVPEWVKFGLSVSEVKNYLGVMEINNLELGFGSELGDGLWMQSGDGIYLYIPVFQLESGILSEQIIGRKSYVFGFDSYYGLNTFWYGGDYNYQHILENFFEKYGISSDERQGDLSEGFTFIDNLPENIHRIEIFQSNENVYIVYVLRFD